MAVRTDTEAVRGLSASEVEVTRLRLTLEGSLPVALGGDAVLTPSLELGVRHDGDDGVRESGVSGTLHFDPAPDTERGLSLQIIQTLGGPSAGGAEGLMARLTLAGLGAEEADDGPGRLDARLGYGLGEFGDRWTAVSELGLGLSQAEREARLGWRLTRAAPGRSPSSSARRRGGSNPPTPPRTPTRA